MSEKNEKSSNSRMSARDLALEAKATIREMTGLEPEIVSGLQWDGETWLVSVEVCELSKIPNTTDIMAGYVVQLDDSGGLLGYKRDRRYLRGEAEDR
jgi:hypothetical protein